jgi:hypothetical protein
MDIPGVTLRTVPGTVPGEVPAAAPEVTFETILAATCPLNRTAEPTVIPTFDCRASRELMDRLTRRSNCVPTPELNLRSTAAVIRRAILDVALRPTQTVSLSWRPRCKRNENSSTTPRATRLDPQVRAGSSNVAQTGAWSERG